MQAAATKAELQTFLTERGTMYVWVVVIKHEHQRVQTHLRSNEPINGNVSAPPIHLLLIISSAIQ